MTRPACSAISCRRAARDYGLCRGHLTGCVWALVRDRSVPPRARQWARSWLGLDEEERHTALPDPGQPPAERQAPRDGRWPPWFIPCPECGLATNKYAGRVLHWGACSRLVDQHPDPPPAAPGPGRPRQVTP